MKITLWLLCITLLLTLLFAGCNRTAAPAAPADTQNQSAPVESTVPPIESIVPPIESTVQPVESTVPPIESTVPPVESTVPPIETTSDPADAGGTYLLVNGTRVELGMRFADVKAGLGQQTAPDQEIGSCDRPDFVRIVHFYPGMTVTENPDGTIWGMELSSMYAGESDAALMGKVRLGTTLAEALAALGAPENASSVKEDCVLIYRPDGQDLYVFLAEDTVRGVSLTLRET